MNSAPPLDLSAIREEMQERLAVLNADQKTQCELVQAQNTAPVSIFPGLDINQFKAGVYFNAPLPELIWVFEGFLLMRNVALLVGPPGTGKSYLSIQLAASIAGGLGAKGILSPGVRGRVLVLAGEEDKRIIPRRLDALRNCFYRDDGPELRDLAENLIVIPMAGETLLLIDKLGTGAPVESQVFAELLELCTGIPDLKLIVIDPLARAYGLDEKDNSAATSFIVILEKLAQVTGAAVLLLHHVNKNSSTRRPGKDKDKYLPALEQEAARGASGFVGAVRAQINIIGLKKEEAKELFIDSGAEDDSYLAVGFPKCSYGPPRPVIFLRRGDNGVLMSMERPEVIKGKQTRELIMEWIVAKIQEQESKHLSGFTKRTILDHSCELMSVVPMATKSQLKSVVQVALDAGELVIARGKNGSGKETDYLALPFTAKLERQVQGELLELSAVGTVHKDPNSSTSSAITDTSRTVSEESCPPPPDSSKKSINSANVGTVGTVPLKREDTVDTSVSPNLPEEPRQDEEGARA